MGVHCLRTKGCLETGHEKGSADSLAANISNRDSPAAGLQRKKIVIITTDALSGFIEGLASEAGNGKVLLGKRGFLNDPGVLQILGQRCVKARIRFRILENLRQRLDVIAQEESCFPPTPFLQSVDNRLV